ncbi:MAG: FtsW/RodA/SpoVE family cell cycle protein [[Ruminococcus] gnavus]|nr:FtsW/RodA/SpoVE family cell cycle protein [Mediterraneibacter gnavus]
MKIPFLNLKQRYNFKDYKFSLVLLVLAISMIGIFMVGSANAEYQPKQIMGVVLGLIAMAVISLIDYKWILNFYWLMYIVNLLLLLAVVFFGTNANGATRWLDLGFIQFQPSDLTKLITILFFARFLSKKEEMINDKKTILEAIGLMIPSLILVYKQPSLSATICIAALFCVIMFMAGLSYKFIGTVLVITIPTVALLIGIVVQPNQPFLKEYQQKRILAWLEPEAYATEEAYQQLNSVMAIGSGQLDGKGYNSDATTSVKNGNFILEPQTDFIFAIIGEELGFVGCCVVIILLLLIVIECIMIGLKAKDTGGRIICGGVGALIGIQTFINISVATGIFPNTGISLPFVSYGLTSLICFFMGIGFVLNVGLQPKKYQ